MSYLALVGERVRRLEIAAPAALSLAMMLTGGAASIAAGLNITPLFLPYLTTAWGTTVVSVLVFVFVEVAKLALVRADDPLPTVFRELRNRAPLLVVPVLLFPMFLIGFTATKSAIPFLVGYSWDGFWADADRWIFSDDVWRITHELLGSRSLPFWEWFYTVGWGGAFFFSAAAVPLFGKPRTVGIFFTAMFATWLVGGCLLAYCFSAAGPIFTHLFDPAVGARFAQMRLLLAQELGEGPVAQTQQYLAGAVQSHVVVKGGGISAMPSMHLGAAAIYVIASRRTLWLVPALLFWIAIFIGSGYFGYHYWIDGIVGSLVAWLCWKGVAACWTGLAEEPAAPMVQMA